MKKNQRSRLRRILAVFFVCALMMSNLNITALAATDTDLTDVTIDAGESCSESNLPDTETFDYHAIGDDENLDESKPDKGEESTEEIIISDKEEEELIEAPEEMISSNAIVAYPVPTASEIASGAFPSAGGVNGAQWWLYDDGTLVVSEGRVHSNAASSPWVAHSAVIDTIIFDGPITGGTSLRGLFAGLTELTAIEGLEQFDTSTVTQMHAMFRYAHSLTCIGDISGWDVSNVDTMSGMFFQASSLTCIGDVSGWNTGSVTSMSYLFSGASSLATLDLSGWDTGSVTTMSTMFRNASSLTSLDLSGWDTSSVTTMTNMFRDADGLSELHLSGWDVSNVTTMGNLFMDASSLERIYGLSEWDTGNVTTMAFMFSGTYNLMYIGDVSGWDTGNVTNMERMFRDASSLTSLDLSSWDTGNVVNMVHLFQRASSLESLDLSGWDTGNVTNMSSMLAGAFSLRQLTLGEDFGFIGGISAALPAIPANDRYTGFWQNVGSGTIHVPQGTYVLTSPQLMMGFDGTTMADTWVWQRTAFWDIALMPDHVFPEATFGYDSQTPHTVTVTNTGNQLTGTLTITLSGSHADDFTVSASTLECIEVGGMTTFTVVPNIDLPEGFYTATVTVTGENGISSSFSVSFTVTEMPFVPPNGGEPTNNPTNSTGSESSESTDFILPPWNGAGNDNTIIPDDDRLIEIDDDGTPRDEWIVYDHQELWIYDDELPVPLGDIPQTGLSGVGLYLFMMAVSMMGMAVLFLGRKRKETVDRLEI
ncbi:MAG: BspA family leucine-rich repeat surface protein [Clostridiales bacterium]|nr:BspA family leucine-rich repeat surface protein [Clostridiales bacterium]